MLAEHPDKIWIDAQGNKRHILVKSYSSEVQKQISMENSTNKEVSNVLQAHSASAHNIPYFPEKCNG